MADPADYAEARERVERDRGMSLSRAALEAAGAGECCDCGDDLSAERRAAAPFARRCVDCQSDHERGQVR